MQSILQQQLRLSTPPLAVTFLEGEVPADIPRWTDPAPSGCALWKHALQGKVFYATPSDHFGCPLGAHLLHVSLSREKSEELGELLGLMQRLEYVQAEEVTAIPKLPRPWSAAVYGPLGQVPLSPDVVIVLGPPGRLMLLLEAARSVGLSPHPHMARPTCAMIPAVWDSDTCITNLGCVGNRIYTELSEEEFYFAFPGKYVKPVENALVKICHANHELQRYHYARV